MDRLTPPMARGQLILVEGLDRSGKSTQVEILKNKLTKSSVLKFPDRSTNIGKIIDKYLTDESFTLPDQSIHLLFSANRWELYDTIISKLNQGETIILDRYIYSGIAYSLAKLQAKHINNEMSSIEWLYGPDKGLPKPDVTLFLTLDLQEIHARKNFGGERYEVLEFQKIVKSNFLKLLDTNDESIKLLDVNGLTIEQVEAKIWTVIRQGQYNELTDNPISYFK